jgi:hypothetical protein
LPVEAGKTLLLEGKAITDLALNRSSRSLLVSRLPLLAKRIVANRYRMVTMSTDDAKKSDAINGGLKG